MAYNVQDACAPEIDVSATQDPEERVEQPGDPVVLAIEHVLRAERSAEAKLEECRQRSKALVLSARERAAAITRRADVRISKLHTAYLQKISEDIAQLANSPTTNREAVESSADNARLAEASRRLAAKLTGGA